MYYLLIKADDDRFFRQELNPDEFEARLKRVVGDSRLEQVRLCVGGQHYDYFVTTEMPELRPKLIGIPGVAEVLVFDTAPFVSA